MRKHKKKYTLPSQKTANIALEEVVLRWDVKKIYPEILHEVHALLTKKKYKKGLLLLSQAYQKHPDSIPVRVRYIDMLLHQGKRKEALENIGNCRDLALLYPDRSWFDIDDYIAFLSFLGHLAVDEDGEDAATEYHYIMHALAPNDARTRYLARKIKKMTSRWAVFKKNGYCVFFQYIRLYIT